MVTQLFFESASKLGPLSACSLTHLNIDKIENTVWYKCEGSRFCAYGGLNHEAGSHLGFIKFLIIVPMN